MAFEESQLQIINDDQKIFAIDLRSLAALRIALAAIVLAFVFGQFANLEMFYTDKGVLPGDLNVKYLNSDSYWSLYWLGSSFRSVQTMMVITALAAGALLLGLQTRLATIVCLVLIWSLQVRNPLVLTAGDILLRMLLFWSMFLPLGKIWSIDALNSSKRPREWNVVSVATVGIMLQVAYMYFFSGISKWNDYWLSGSAIEYSMNLEMYVKPVGTMLAGYPALLKVLTYLTLLAEVVFPILLFVPRIATFNRGFAMGVFWLLHIGIFLTMSIGLFSITAICAWIIFVPSEQWNAMLGEPVGFTGQKPARTKRRSIVFQFLAGVFLVYITLQNLANAGIWPANKIPMLEKFGASTMTIQKFQMFNRPPTVSPWFEYLGQLEDGETVDLFYFPHRQFGQKPDSVFNYMQSQNWRRIHSNLVAELDPGSDGESEIHREIKLRLLEQVVQLWNRKHPGQQVLSASLICHLDPIRITDEASEEHTVGSKVVWASYSRVND